VQDDKFMCLYTYVNKKCLLIERGMSLRLTKLKDK